MAKRTLAPIALFVYTRLGHTQRTVAALQKNALARKSDLFIFSDGPKSPGQAPAVQVVRDYVHSITGFKSVTVVESAKNQGLAASITGGVTRIVNKYGKIIVIEDDIVTSPHFLSFMNDALRRYARDERVISVSGYVYPATGLPETFFIRGADCWGWATWKRGWAVFEKDGKKLLRQLEEKGLIQEFNYNGAYDYAQMLRDQISGKNDSWAVCWYASAFIGNKLTLYPGKSLVRNIGIDGSGTHGGLVNVYATALAPMRVRVAPIPVAEDTAARKKFAQFFRKMHSRFFRASLLLKALIFRGGLSQ